MELPVRFRPYTYSIPFQLIVARVESAARNQNHFDFLLVGCAGY
jgi:hypothetical protein